MEVRNVSFGESSSSYLSTTTIFYFHDYGSLDDPLSLSNQMAGNVCIFFTHYYSL